jgi:RHS repeat-associated protein
MRLTNNKMVGLLGLVVMATTTWSAFAIIPRQNDESATNDSITNLPSGHLLAYDCESNLSCVSNTVSGVTDLYWYDSIGRRIAKRESGLLTLYIWDGMDIIATANADGTIREYFTRGIGIAGDVGSLIAETRFINGTPSTVYLHSNWRGDIVMATDSSGSVIGAYDYTTFGEPLSASGTYTPRFGFSSKERDASGLVYYGFRYYSPVLCRWITEDPLGEAGGLNLYQFCYNNPVNRVDTDGEIAPLIVAAILVFAGYEYANTPAGPDDFTEPGGQGVARMVGVATMLSGGGTGKSVSTVCKLTRGKSIIASDGTAIIGFTEHGVDRALGGALKRAGVKPSAILDALKNPTNKVVKEMDKLGRPSMKYKGANATVVVNPETGKVVSVWPTSGAGVP